MSKKQWIELTNKCVSGNDKTALYDYFTNRHYEIMKKMGKLFSSDDIKGTLDYMNDVASRLSAYETLLLRLRKIEYLKDKLDSNNLDMRIATDKGVKAIINYEVGAMLRSSKAFKGYAKDPNGLDIDDSNKSK